MTRPPNTTLLTSAKAVKRSCFLSFAARRTPLNPWDTRFPLCVRLVLH